MPRIASVLCLSSALGVVLLAGPPAHGQPQQEPEPGERVRVTLEREAGREGTRRLSGTIAEWRHETLVLEVTKAGEPEPRELSRAGITRIERSVRPSRKGKAAGIGFAVGFAAMLVVGNQVSGGGCFQYGDCIGYLVLWSAVRAIPVAVVGALAAPGEEWTDVPIGPAPPGGRGPASEGPQLRVLPVVGRRAGLSLAVSF